MATVETVFRAPDGRTLYLDLRPELLPREGETVDFNGNDMQGFPKDVPFVVANVAKTYNTYTGELTFVSVALRLKEEK